jgi:hypothetical protein
MRVGGLPEQRVKMRAQNGTSQRISMGALVLDSLYIGSPAAPRRDRRLRPTNRDAWSRMSVLERCLAADRDDPSFDYAAN